MHIRTHTHTHTHTYVYTYILHTVVQQGGVDGDDERVGGQSLRKARRGQ